MKALLQRVSSSKVEVEGKVVNKLMVNGKDFFDGDTKIATKNIPSNAIDKVQILKNYSEVGQLSGVQNNQDNIAINIKLKKGKDKFWFVRNKSFKMWISYIKDRTWSRSIFAS